LLQVMPVSLQVVLAALETAGPLVVAPVARTHSRSLALCTGPLTPLTAKRR